MHLPASNTILLSVIQPVMADHVCYANIICVHNFIKLFYTEQLKYIITF